MGALEPGFGEKRKAQQVVAPHSSRCIRRQCGARHFHAWVHRHGAIAPNLKESNVSSGRWCNTSGSFLYIKSRLLHPIRRHEADIFFGSRRRKRSWPTAAVALGPLVVLLERSRLADPGLLLSENAPGLSTACSGCCRHYAPSGKERLEGRRPPSCCAPGVDRSVICAPVGALSMTRLYHWRLASPGAGLTGTHGLAFGLNHRAQSCSCRGGSGS